jgi:hypothetical protein
MYSTALVSRASCFVLLTSSFPKKAHQIIRLLMLHKLHSNKIKTSALITKTPTAIGDINAIGLFRCWQKFDKMKRALKFAGGIILLFAIYYTIERKDVLFDLLDEVPFESIEIGALLLPAILYLTAAIILIPKIKKKS